MNLNMRYKVVPLSTSHHCCFKASVLDTDVVTGKTINGNITYLTVCESYYPEEAENIASKLNVIDNQRKKIEGFWRSKEND